MQVLKRFLDGRVLRIGMDHSELSLPSTRAEVTKFGDVRTELMCITPEMLQFSLDMTGATLTDEVVLPTGNPVAYGMATDRDGEGDGWVFAVNAGDARPLFGYCGANLGPGWITDYCGRLDLETVDGEPVVHYNGIVPDRAQPASIIALLPRHAIVEIQDVRQDPRSTPGRRVAAGQLYAERPGQPTFHFVVQSMNYRTLFLPESDVEAVLDTASTFTLEEVD